jgi:hypothetical protein
MSQERGARQTPYKVKGSAVYHKKGNRWVKKQQTGSPEKARAAMRLLEAVEHNPDFKPK